MPLFEERQLQWMDIMERFEAKPHSEHVYNARGFIERLKSEGDRFLKREPKQLRRWHRCCTDLLNLLKDLRQRRDLEQQSLETAMREFIQEFEHSTHRMYQLLYQALDPDNDEAVREIMGLFNWAYRFSTYALVSAWIDDKQEDNSWWRQYNDDVVAGTYKSKEFLYVEEPDVTACYAGELAVGAKNRALEAANQIRGLHGLSAVRYSSRYDQQVQEAALIQAANQFLTHRPAPSVKCYSPAGAAGSRTSNLQAGGRSTTWLGADRDPALHMVWWTNDKRNRSNVAAAGHRRGVLDPFAVEFAYGQVEGYAAQKVFGFDDGPGHAPQITVDFVAFPFEVYPFNLVLGDPPWSFSVIEDKDKLRGNKYDYFREATITVIRTEDETELVITDRYTDSKNFNLPNFLSWRVQGWDYDTLYEVEIGNVAMQSGETRSFEYPVFIERDNLEG